MKLRGWLCALSMCSSAGAALAQPLVEPEPADPAHRTVEVQPRVEQAFAERDRVRVFIVLRDSDSPGNAGQAVLDVLGPRFDLWHRYRSIPVIAGELSRDGLTQLRHQPAVAAVQLDGTGTGGLAEALPAAGVDEVHEVKGLSGKGITVAVLDSGASTTHPAMQGAIVAQRCFTSSACPPNNARQGESAEDDHNHGSNVTGIVASRGGGNVSKGYAPAASIVAVKVLNRQNAGQISDWVAGFDWVYTNREMLEVKVINASLVSTAEYANAADCDRSETALAMVTKKLVDAGITIAASSGNTGHAQTMTAPACNTGVIAVGASYDSNLGQQPEGGGTYRSLGGGNWPACSDPMATAKTIACFTSTAGPRLDLLAPGAQITSTGKGTTRAMFRGTSQASPGVAGLAALLLECNPALTPSMILNVLKTTGEPVMDPRTNLSYPLIRGMEAVQMACGSGTMGMGGAGGGMAQAGAAAAGSGGSAPVAGAGAGGTPPAAGGGGVGPIAGTPAVAGTGAVVPPALPPANSAGRAGATPPAGAAGMLAGTAGNIGQQSGSIQTIPRARGSDSGCHVVNAGGRGIDASLLGLALALASLARRRRARI